MSDFRPNASGRRSSSATRRCPSPPSAPASTSSHKQSEQRDAELQAGRADFGTLLAIRQQTSLSVILFRHGSQRRPAGQAALLKANLPQLVGALEAGSIVVIQPDRIRIRALPLIP